jgi:acyl dehydratase
MLGVSPCSKESVMAPPDYRIETLERFVGRELGVSRWFEVGQDRIQQFADCTGDHQWIHVDVERARRESLYGTTIAHGYLTLAMIPNFSKDVGVVPPGVSQSYNYGSDRVRFMAPVPAGARLRGRIELLSIDRKQPGRLLLKTRQTVEIEGGDKPALVAELLTLIVVDSPK